MSETTNGKKRGRKSKGDKTRKARIVVLIPPALKRAIQEQAQAAGLSDSQFILRRAQLDEGAA